MSSYGRRLAIPIPKQYVQPGHYCFFKPLGARCYRFRMDAVGLAFYNIVAKRCRIVKEIVFVPEKQREELEHVFHEARVPVMFLRPEPSYWN